MNLCIIWMAWCNMHNNKVCLYMAHDTVYYKTQFNIHRRGSLIQLSIDFGVLGLKNIEDP